MDSLKVRTTNGFPLFRNVEIYFAGNINFSIASGKYCRISNRTGGVQPHHRSVA